MAGDRLLPPAAMAEVDAAAIAAGTSGRLLMERAGRAVVRAATARFPPQPVLVACGPGNNGGDGWVIARRLRRAGWPVTLASLVKRDRLKGDAASAAAAWDGAVESLAAEHGEHEGLVVDALFGAGLARPVEGAAAEVIERWNARRVEVAAVDVPSGVDGATGAATGAAVNARLTVTFVCGKPGHWLLPGRLKVGELVVADIGIPDAVVAARDVGLRRNSPALWRHLLPRRQPADHKYRFGHAVVVGGPASSAGAARMAAYAALRVGAGLVSVACPHDALAVYAESLTAVMTKPVDGPEGLRALLADRRLNAVLLGPGLGVGAPTRRLVEAAVTPDRAVVLDADALTSFAEHREQLYGLLHDRCVLTPHDGEHARLFDGHGDRLARACAAAATCGAVVLLKGSDSVVAAPDGRAAIATDAPPTLATAGTGDVLAGIVAGLLAQGMPAFEAACAGMEMHAAAARVVAGPLIAEDLAERLPRVLAGLA